MKKALIVILVILCVSAIAVSAIIFVPKAVNESQVNKLASGGVKVGETTFILSDAFEGSAKVENEKMEFCFTQVYGQTEFVKEKHHLFLIGEYSVGLDKNITLDVEESYYMLELVGTEKNIENYKKINSKMFQEYLDRGNYTQQQYDREMTLINGEKAYPMNEEEIVTSAKLRMDTETGKVYLISYGNMTETIEYAYHDSGEIKTETYKGYGTIPLGKIEYDTKGNQLISGSEREFYDSGVIKRESYYYDYKDHIFEYDVNGRLIKSYCTVEVEGYNEGTLREVFIKTYEYNSDGICVLIESESDGHYSKTKILGYGHEIRTRWTSNPENKLVEEYFDGEIIKEETYKDGKLIRVDNY